MSIKLEIACFNAESALIAEQGGADRIEFCANVQEGGTTPSMIDFIELKSKISIPVYVMIRARGGDFIYSDLEFEQMKNSLIQFKEAGADGFVFGILDANRKIDITRNKYLLDLADGLPCTFHKAFDEVIEPFIALQQIIDLGFENILSSGQAVTAMLGLPILKQLIDQSENKINIMVGGSVRSSNLQLLMDELNASWYHSSAIIQGETADFEEVRNLKSKSI
ncbi:MAG: copper homeostasis protein CutC [Bacteroidetes bacterium]|nr:copper homeostasis protein CutC [Bacteroidota bacterium]